MEVQLQNWYLEPASLVLVKAEEVDVEDVLKVTECLVVVKILWQEKSEIKADD